MKEIDKIEIEWYEQNFFYYFVWESDLNALIFSETGKEAFVKITNVWLIY